MTTAKTTKSTMQSLSPTGELIAAGVRLNQEQLISKPIDSNAALSKLNQAIAVVCEKTEVDAETRNALVFSGACILKLENELKQICSRQEPKEVTQEETVNE